MNKTSGSGDDRLWKPEVDKAGNGYAVIRFLPAPAGEELLGETLHSRLPRNWWMVYRELSDHWVRKIPCLNTTPTLELWY